MKSAATLNVFVAGELCGTLSEDRHGALSFAYDPSYQGVPLSLSMPVGLARYGDRAVRPYLLGLLPDEEGTRASIGASLGVSGDNLFRLLRVIGLDCPGAVQVCDPGIEPPTKNGAGDLVELCESEIEVLLAALREDAAVAWVGTDLAEGRWSLGGCQAKLALRRDGERWYACRGAAATTHILKPGVVGFDHQALVEYLSMRVASAIGLPVAEAAYHQFGVEPAIVVRRYDRVTKSDGSVARIHQEDLCQALGVPPASKYADQGGPSTPDIVALLKRTGANARENVYRFALYLFFNYLMGATDAHAKNHSLLFVTPGDIRLAPLYDVASIAPYRSLTPRKRKPLRAALSIGGENRFGMVGIEHVERMVNSCGLADLGLSAAMLADRFRMMASLIPQAVDQEVSAALERGLAGAGAVSDALRAEITANCARTLDRL